MHPTCCHAHHTITAVHVAVMQILAAADGESFNSIEENLICDELSSLYM